MTLDPTIKALEQDALLRALTGTPEAIIVGELFTAEREGWGEEDTALGIIAALDALGWDVVRRG